MAQKRTSATSNCLWEAFRRDGTFRHGNASSKSCFRRLPKISKSDWIEITIIGGVSIVAFTIFLLTGMQRVNGAVGTVVMSLSPAAMAVAAVLFMNDHMGWRKILAVSGSGRGSDHQCVWKVYPVFGLGTGVGQPAGYRCGGESDTLYTPR